MQLCTLIEPAIIRQTKHCVENGIVTPEVCLHCAIRWLSGCTWWSNCRIAGIVKTTFCGCCHCAIAAIISCEELCFHFQVTNHKIQRAASDFQAISSHRVINSCVGALNGLLVKIVTLSNHCTVHTGWRASRQPVHQAVRELLVMFPAIPHSIMQWLGMATDQ